MKKKIIQTIDRKRMLKKGMHIIIGLSGGPDSVCLFDVLTQMADDMDWNICAVHVNHGLRPVAADDDQRYVEELCARKNIPCHVYKADCSAMARELSMTSEEAGRKVRYDAFSDTAEKICAGGAAREDIAIALTHNANDQAETILFRILRGTGTDGLYGIPYVRCDENGFKIVRPILDISREEIERYCRQSNLSPRTDHTNAQNIYTRNKIRNMLIPYIKENFNENIIETLNRLGKVAAEDRDYLRGEAQRAYDEALCEKPSADPRRIYENKVTLEIKPLLKLHRAVRMRVYTIALGRVGMTKNMTYAQAEGIDNILRSKSPSAMYDLSDDTGVSREYDKLSFFRGSAFAGENWETEWALSSMSEKEFGLFRQNCGGRIYGAFRGVSIDQLTVRTRRKGDWISVGGGSKKIKDFFIDEKVPKMYRDDMLLLARGSEILWVLPSEHFERKSLTFRGRFSDKYRASETAFENRADTIIVLEKL